MGREVGFLSLAAALMMAVVIPALSQTRTDITPQARALYEVLFARSPGDDVTNDPKWRASLATALHRYCESVMAQVPRNTPDEDKWVDGEFADIDATPMPPPPSNSKEFDERMSKRTSRLIRVMSSVENARKELRAVLGDCSTLTNKLIELKSGAPSTEALLWAQLARYFYAEDDIWNVAEIVGIVSPKYCKHLNGRQLLAVDVNSYGAGHDEHDICLWYSIGIGINVGAVIPLLRDIAKC
jgi:hypothetical protein